MSVDGLFPDPVARSRNSEDASEDGFGRQVGVVDKPVHDDVVGALEVLGLGERGFTVVKLTARGEYILKLKIFIVIFCLLRPLLKFIMYFLPEAPVEALHK